MPKLRRLARTVAFQALTAALLRSDEAELSLEQSLQYVVDEFNPELTGQEEFAAELLRGVFTARKVIDEKITAFAPQWPLNKLSTIERALLELGSYELMFETATPLAVIVNEWVDIAKEFGDETAGKFINGVLSNLGHAVRSSEKTPSAKL